PAGEFVQATHFSHNFVTGAQMQMVGVAQHDLGADFFQVQGRKSAFDGSSSSNILESRGLHSTVHGNKLTAPSGTFLFNKTVRHESFSPYPIVSSKKVAVQGAIPAPPFLAIL